MTEQDDTAAASRSAPGHDDSVSAPSRSGVPGSRAHGESVLSAATAAKRTRHAEDGGEEHLPTRRTQRLLRRVAFVRRCADLARSENRARGAKRSAGHQAPDLATLATDVAACVGYVQGTLEAVEPDKSALHRLLGAAQAAAQASKAEKDTLAYRWKAVERQSGGFKRARDAYIEAARAHGAQDHESGGPGALLAAVARIQKHVHGKDSGAVPHEFSHLVAPLASSGPAGTRAAVDAWGPKALRKQSSESSLENVDPRAESQGTGAGDAARAEPEPPAAPRSSERERAEDRKALFACLDERHLIDEGVKKLLEAHEGEWAVRTWSPEEVRRAIKSCQDYKNEPYAPKLALDDKGRGVVNNSCSSMGPPGAKKLRKKQHCFWPCAYKPGPNDPYPRCRRLGIGQPGARLGWRRADQEGAAPAVAPLPNPPHAAAPDAPSDTERR